MRHCILGMEARTRVGVQVEKRLYILYLGCGKSVNDKKSQIIGYMPKSNTDQTRQYDVFGHSLNRSPSLPISPSVFHLYRPKAGIWWGVIFIPVRLPTPSSLPPLSDQTGTSPLTVMDGAPSWNPKIAPRAQFCT